MQLNRRQFGAAALGGASLALTGTAFAQSYPSKPVKIPVSYTHLTLPTIYSV